MEDLDGSWFPFPSFFETNPPLPFLRFSYWAKQSLLVYSEEKLGAYCLQPESTKTIIYLSGLLWGIYEWVHIVVAMVPGT